MKDRSRSLPSPFLDWKSVLEIDNLIFFLIRNGIEDLTLEMWTSEFYKLPLSFFTSQKLRRLNLRCCLIESTPAFIGFSRLIKLKLYTVPISGKVLGSLIPSCPLLELLDLLFFSYRNDVEINVPNLKSFRFRGIAKSIILKNVPLLASVSIVPNEHIDEEYFRKNGKCNLVEFFHGLPLLQKLHLGYLSNKSLAADEVPTRLLTTLVYLKDLKEVELKDVTGTGPQLELIEILLTKSPSLEKMRIQNHLGQTSGKGFMLLKELMKLRRASKKAEVTYADVKEKQVCSLKYM